MCNRIIQVQCTNDYNRPITSYLFSRHIWKVIRGVTNLWINDLYVWETYFFCFLILFYFFEFFSTKMVILHTWCVKNRRNDSFSIFTHWSLMIYFFFIKPDVYLLESASEICIFIKCNKNGALFFFLKIYLFFASGSPVHFMLQKHRWH